MTQATALLVAAARMERRAAASREAWCASFDVHRFDAATSDELWRVANRRAKAAARLQRAYDGRVAA